MSKIIWDKAGDRTFETGADRGVLYKPNNKGVYSSGVAWNGLVSVSEKPSGAEATPQYADNIKYLNLVSAENFGATLEAFTSPVEFDECDGSASPIAGVSFGQQRRRSFGLSFRSLLGNDIEGTDYGYKLHLIYGALAAPTEKAYSTVNDSPEAITLSWELTTTPAETSVDYKPTASVTIDSTQVDPAKLKELEDILYGTAGTEPRLPLPMEVVAILEGTTVEVVPVKPTQVGNVVTIPTITGVVYSIDGETVSGDVTLTEDVVVVAAPTSGYKFPNVVDTDWFFDFS